ncbi:MAG TPA: FkbM family methyltransferase [Actinomycetota bacterium]|nr:FkbM family methyltransferase [Actinomycetota bacterium]
MNETVEVRLSAPHDLVPYHLTGPASDQGVIGEIQRSGGAYQPQVMAALRRVLDPRSVVVDVGANIGVFALVLGRLVPGGTVFAFEPDPQNYAYLRANIARNRAANVVAEPLAVYDRAGEVAFVSVPERLSASFVSPAPGTNGSAQQVGNPVEAVRLDDYVAARGVRRIDLVMIDAEGAEFAVLRGARTTLAVFQPALLVEVNPVSLRRVGGASFRDLVGEIAQERAVYAITAGGHLARVVSERHVELLLRREGLVDLLCLPRGHPARHLARPGGLQAWARGARQVAQLEAAFSGGAPPENNFVAEPSFSLSAPMASVWGLPDMDIDVATTVHNTGPYWLSSDFVYHPVHVSYRWLDEAGAPVEVLAHRARFPAPLAPGASATVRVIVRTPPEVGFYTLALTMLQEGFSWFDDLDPSLRFTLPAEVVAPQ